MVEITEVRKVPRTVLRFFWYVTKPFLPAAVATVFFVIVYAIANQSLTLFFKWIVEAIEANNIEDALWYGMLYPVAVFCVQLLMRSSSIVAVHWLPKSRQFASDRLSAYTLEHSSNYFSNRFAGALLTKVNNVVGAVESLMHDFLWSYLSLIVSLIVSLYLIATVDLTTAILFLCLITVLFTVNKFLMPGKKVRSLKTARASSKLRGTIVDVFSNISTTRQYTAFAYERAHMQKQSDNWTELAQKNWLYSEFTQILNVCILFAFGLGMFYWLIMQWESTLITSAEFIFVLAIFSQLTGSLIFIGRMMVNAARVAGEMEEGLSEIVVPHDIIDSPTAVPLQVTQGKIDCTSVRFMHEETLVFENLHLTIAPGQRVGVVGSSGAGKSTLVSLLLHEHTIASGVIAIDGQNIAHVTQDSLRGAIAVVPQEPALFHRTIRENIVYGKPDATDEEVIEVAKKAYAHDFIMSLPLHYDTLVGERGVKLSGGQKQRIAIARAMLKDAPILILDEATSALDSESEVSIQRALHQLMAGKTVIAIAHRLSTLREMDRIIVLDQGRILEDGTHDSLLTYGGVYAKLWQHQAGGFVGE